MPAGIEDRVERVPMPLDVFLDFVPPEGVRAEWVDGAAVMSPTGRREHQIIAKRLARVIEDALEGVEAYQEGGLELARSRRIPDVVVETRGGEASDELWNPATPVLVAEVVSKSSRTEDRLRKPIEYLEAGIPFLILADRFEGTLLVLRHDGAAWALELELDADVPVGEVEIDGYGRVTFDLATLFAF